MEKTAYGTLKESSCREWNDNCSVAECVQGRSMPYWDVFTVQVSKAVKGCLQLSGVFAIITSEASTALILAERSQRVEKMVYAI